MFFNAKGGRLYFDNTYMEYIRFGRGRKHAVFLPGLGDGLRSVKGTAPLMALLYRKYSGDYTVYMFSRKRQIAHGSSTRDMARDAKQAMDMLGIEKADIIGVSMGGMIAQHLAADYPEKLNKLVLVVSTAKSNPLLAKSVSRWTAMARQGDHRALMESNLRLIYSDGYYRRCKALIPLIGRITKPKSYERFIRQAEACLSHNAVESLGAIKAPTLIIGGEKDRVLGGEASRELSACIAGSKLHIYPKGYHSVYEEEKNFNELVLNFLRDEN